MGELTVDVSSTRVAVVEEPGSVSIQRFDVPALGPEHVLLRVLAVGVCATDGKIYEGKSKDTPIVPGHEVVGEVVAIGGEAERFHGVSRGDRVVVFPFIGCGRCRGCLSHGVRSCEVGLTYGTTPLVDDRPELWGGYSEYMCIVPGSTLFPIADDVSPAVGTLVSAVLGNSMAWIQASPSPVVGRPLLIQGPGPQGLGLAAAADFAGASPIVVTGAAGDGHRLDLAKEFGADVCIDVTGLDGDLRDRLADELDGSLPPTVIDVTGHPDGVASSLDVVGRDGSVVVAGLLGSGTSVPVRFDDLLFGHNQVIPVHAHDVEHVEQALALVESNDYPFESMISARFDLPDAEAAIETTIDRPGEAHVKSIIEP